MQILVNDEMMIEYRQVLERLVARDCITEAVAQLWLRRVGKGAVRIQSLSMVKQSPDPKDNRYLACAIDGKADYLVTGDKKHLLSLKQIGKTAIVSPRELMDRLQDANVGGLG